MSKQLHAELKREFQLERLILFSDAVFAIAITLLVIEIKVPEIGKSIVSDSLLQHELNHLLPKFVGFIISFMIIGIYWTVHHKIFGFVVNYDRKLLVLNLFFLFGVALMPFSTSFYSEYVLQHVMTPVIFYVANICLIGFFNFLIWRHVSSKKSNLCEGVYPLFRKYLSVRALIVPIIFTVSAFIYYANPRIAIWVPMTIPFIMRVALSKMRKRVETEHIKYTKVETPSTD